MKSTEIRQIISLLKLLNDCNQDETDNILENFVGFTTRELQLQTKYRLMAEKQWYKYYQAEKRKAREMKKQQDAQEIIRRIEERITRIPKTNEPMTKESKTQEFKTKKTETKKRN